MDMLILRALQGHATSEEASRLRIWRNESLTNEAIYRDLSRIWSGLSDVDFETIAPAPSAICLQAEVPQVGTSSYRRTSRSAWIGISAVAATIAIYLGSEAIGTRLLRTDAPVIQVKQLSTGASETLMTQLSDGTTVYLAPNSTLQVVLTATLREVRLEGRAFFGVAEHGALWPFVIRGSRGMVQVLGTRFEFWTADDSLRVVVVDGKVDFTTAGENVQLADGQMSRTGIDVPTTVVPLENVDEMFDWMGRTLVFENTPLEKVALEIESRYDAVVEVQGADLARRTISGGFEKLSFEDLVLVICRVAAAECIVEEGRAVISSRLR